MSTGGPVGLERRNRTSLAQVYQLDRRLISGRARVGPPWPAADNSRCGGPGGGGAMERRLDLCAFKARGEKGRDESIARAGRVDRLDLRRLHPPAPIPFRRLAAGRAPLDDDQGIERGEARAL